MRHKVYAFVDKQPAGLVKHFNSLKEARDAKNAVELYGIKDAFGKIREATAKIVVS